MMGAMVKVLSGLPMKRVGAYWDEPTRRRFALWAVCPHCLALAGLELGTAIHPRDDDLPSLMVVSDVDRSQGLVTTVAHDLTPPPTLYFHQEPTSWPLLT